MKMAFVLLLTVFSLNSFPGDKGNLAPVMANYDSSSLEQLMERALEVEDSFYTPLALKKGQLVNGKIVISGVHVLEDSQLVGKYFSVVIEIMKRDDRDLLESFVFENPKFLEAFDLKQLKKSLVQMPDLSEGDRQALVTSLDDLIENFWNEFNEAIKKSLGEEKARKFMQEIDLKKLGV
jgi:hypothetical protein